MFHPHIPHIVRVSSSWFMTVVARLCSGRFRALSATSNTLGPGSCLMPVWGLSPQTGFYLV